MVRFETIRRRYDRLKADLVAMESGFNGYQPKQWHIRYVQDVGALLEYYDDLDEAFEIANMTEGT